MNDACLVYDGKLVIDATFHTNDVAVRAAGPFTKFQRSYHADDWTHEKFNAKEIGIQVSAVDVTDFVYQNVYIKCSLLFLNHIVLIGLNLTLYENGAWVNLCLNKSIPFGHYVLIKCKTTGLQFLVSGCYSGCYIQDGVRKYCKVAYRH